MNNSLIVEKHSWTFEKNWFKNEIIVDKHSWSYEKNRFKNEIIVETTAGRTKKIRFKHGTIIISKRTFEYPGRNTQKTERKASLKIEIFGIK